MDNKSKRLASEVRCEDQENIMLLYPRVFLPLFYDSSLRGKIASIMCSRLRTQDGFLDFHLCPQGNDIPSLHKYFPRDVFLRNHV